MKRLIGLIAISALAGSALVWACDWSYFTSENSCLTTNCSGGCSAGSHATTRYYCLIQGDYCCMCVEENYNGQPGNCTPIYQSLRERHSYASESCQHYLDQGEICPTYTPVGGGG